MLDNEKIGNRILQLRKNENMTQVELSEMLGISHQAVSKWENGESLPDIEQLLRLSKLFDRSIEQLLLGYSDELSINSNIQPNSEIKDSSEALWNGVLKEIKKQINENSYNTWFQYATGIVEEDTFIIISPNQFSSEWLLNKYSSLIAQTLNALSENANMKLKFQTAVPDQRIASIEKK